MSSDTNSPAIDVVEPVSSDYFKNLTENIRQRYITKMLLINDIDPYCLKKSSQFWISSNDPPTVSEVDIFSYFVLTHSSYTAEQFKAYKSLHATKYVEAGFVEDLLTFKVNGDYYVVMANVRKQTNIKYNFYPSNIYFLGATFYENV